MRKLIIISCALACFLAFGGFKLPDFVEKIIYFGQSRDESAARIFNMANEAMIKGDDGVAIALFYKILEEYPGFRKYRDDVLYRLGNLLFKAERYDEAERVYSEFAAKYSKSRRIKKVYERLIQIYAGELRNEAKAQEIRDMYAGRFGKSPTLKNIDKTMVLLTGQEGKAEVLRLEPKDMRVSKIVVMPEFEREFFPVRHHIKKKSKSPNNRYFAERVKVKKNYYLYIVDRKTGKRKRVKSSKNGYAPQWSWNSRYVAFTSMNWAKMERDIKIYDLKRRRTRTLFTGKQIEPLLCFSPDNSKIGFWYRGQMWVMNTSGSLMGLLSKELAGKDIRLMAWGREGDKILMRKRAKQKKYYVLSLGRREIEIVK